jgi:Ras family
MEEGVSCTGVLLCCQSTLHTCAAGCACGAFCMRLLMLQMLQSHACHKLLPRFRRAGYACHCTQMQITSATLQAAPDNPDAFAFVLLGNKADCGADARMVSERAAAEWCASQGNMPYLETSAKSDLNVSKAFTTIVDLALNNKSADQPPMPQAGNLDFSEGMRPQARSSCCG